VGPWTVDCLWRARRVVVELDGRQHERPHQADTDDDRDLWLRGHGYVARRYGTRQIEQRPDEVIATSSRRSATPPREPRSGCCKPRPGGRCPRRSARE
jgi:very-short-patch-repair endonuclease